jgi:hypothetical protein
MVVGLPNISKRRIRIKTTPEEEQVFMVCLRVEEAAFRYGRWMRVY